MNRIVVIGAGGFAREVKLYAKECWYKFVGYVVSDLNKIGEHDSEDEILGDYTWLEQNQDKFDYFAIGIGNPKVRVKVGEELSTKFPNKTFPNLIHPDAKINYKTCTFGKGIIICPGVIGTVHLTFKDFCAVNLSCTIGHEATIGRGCVINPGCNISGGVNIEDECLIGTGAQILQYLNIGRGATVGAGAVATKDVPDNTTVVGIPAKKISYV